MGTWTKDIWGHVRGITEPVRCRGNGHQVSSALRTLGAEGEGLEKLAAARQGPCVLGRRVGMLFFGLWGATERRSLGMLSPEQDREIKKVQCQQ